MKRILFIMAIAVLSISCVTGSGGGKPGWVDNKNSVYDEANYMVEIGQGASLKDAKRNGAASLAAIFKTSIKVETNIKTRYNQLSRGGNLSSSEETDIDENITQLADQELINVNYGQSWTNELGQVFVLTYIDRMETGNIYRDRIKVNNSSIDDFISRASSVTSLIERYALLDGAYVLAQGNKMLLDQLDILYRPYRLSVSPSYDFDQLRADRRDSAKNTAFSVGIDGEVGEKVSNVISDQLTAFGFSMDDNGLLSVSGTVRFEPITLDNGFENIKFFLNINLLDEAGIPVVTLEKSERISALSVNDAKNRAFVEINKVLKRELMKELVHYFDSFIR